MLLKCIDSQISNINYISIFVCFININFSKTYILFVLLSVSSRCVAPGLMVDRLRLGWLRSAVQLGSPSPYDTMRWLILFIVVSSPETLEPLSERLPISFKKRWKRRRRKTLKFIMEEEDALQKLRKKI